MAAAEVLDSYVYFETKTGLLAYTYGPQAVYNADFMVGSSVAYVSETPTERHQKSTGRYVKKLIWEGTEGSLTQDEKFRSLPKHIRNDLEKYTIVHPITAENLVIIPPDDIAHLYSPQIALIDNPHPNQTERVIEILVKSGIPYAALGLYGSLQTGVVNSGPVTDVDVLVYGVKHYHLVKELTSSQSNKRSLLSKHTALNSRENWRVARQARDRIAKLFLDDTLHADIRMVRTPGDPVGVSYANLQLEPNNFYLEGQVINSEQALCIPSVIDMESDQGRFQVSTRNYIYFAAATDGARVKILGRKVQDQSVILITDPKEHYILADLSKS